MNILLFAGTSDGRTLAEQLAAMPVNLTVSVATEYGHELLLGLPAACRVVVGRRDAAAMRELMEQTACDAVIDATHPYAVEASRAIEAAARAEGLPRFRLARRSSAASEALYVESVEAAAAALRDSDGNILLTTGSKQLGPFTAIPHYADRIYPRVLPMEEALRECLRLGYRQSHIISMQGPFGTELNLALFRQFAIRYLVTKDGGKAGGFPEKIQAAAEAGAAVIVIGRPSADEGFDFDGILGAVRSLMENGA